MPSNIAATTAFTVTITGGYPSKTAINKTINKTSLKAATLKGYGGKLLRASVFTALTTLCLATPSVAADFTENRSSNAQIDLADSTPLPNLQSLQNPKELTLTLPKIEHFKTKTGVPVAFVQSKTLPIVDIDLRFNAGSARDAEVREQGFGIAGMTATMLMQGTNKLDEDEFSKQAEMLGVELSSNAYKDMFVVSLRSLSDQNHLVPAISLVKQMLTSPRFDDSTLERNKARLMVALQQQQQNPSSIAGIAFSNALFGDHPYAHQTSGTLQTVPKLTTQDLQTFKNRYLVAANASLAMTGDLTLAQAKDLANDMTSILPKGEPARPITQPTPPTAQRIHIPFDSTQTTVIMGQLGDKRATDNTAMQQQTNFTVGNEILAGGNFNARLMTKVRKELGYTYGISGGVSPMQAKGPYAISFSTRNDKTDDAINATIDTIQTTLDTGVNAQEVELTKNNLKNGFPMSFASNAGINGMLGMMTFYDLPDTYLTEYLTRIDNVTPNQVNTALKEKLNPDEFVIVTVGMQDDSQ